MALNSSPRGSLGRLLGALVIGVVVLAGTGLFAIQYHHRRAAQAMAEVLEAGTLLDLARSAQVNFKLQVQEWKNLLLRSQTAAELQQQTAKFTAQETVVERQLGELAADPGLSDEMRREVEAMREEHQRLGGLYRAAMPAYVPGDAQTIFAVDGQVRGIDRNLNQRIDALAEAIVARARAQAAALQERGEREYDTLRAIVSSVAAAVILLSGVLAWLATRGTELRRSRTA